jgi:SnoaL-like protein
MEGHRQKWFAETTSTQLLDVSRNVTKVKRGFRGGSTVTETVNNLMEANLLEVFNERDAQRRAVAIESTYAPDVRWTDDEGVVVGREALEAKATALQSQMQGLVFTKASPVYQTRGFGYLAWTLGPDGGDPVASGFDVAVVRDDLISELYTVITT